MFSSFMSQKERDCIFIRILSELDWLIALRIILGHLRAENGMCRRWIVRGQVGDFLKGPRPRRGALVY